MHAIASADRRENSIDGKSSGGTLVIAGGGELPAGIRERFVELAGGAKARIVMLPAATVEAERMTYYADTWRGLGVADIRVLGAAKRAAADDADFSASIDDATGVWIGGGVQSWLAEIYRGTLVERRIRALLSRGGVVGGTSAGAAVMSDVMIAGGRDDPHLAQGFGLWDGVVLDQHFLRRNRWKRLHQTLQTHPELTGFGIDESTALVVEPGTGRFTVLGNSYVVAFVPQGESRPGRVEFLRAGDTFDLRSLRNGAPLGMHPTDFEELLLGD